MALATDRTDLPDSELRLIETCDLIVQVHNAPTASNRDAARKHVETLEHIRLSDRRLDWTLQMLSRAVDSEP